MFWQPIISHLTLVCFSVGRPPFSWCRGQGFPHALQSTPVSINSCCCAGLGAAWGYHDRSQTDAEQPFFQNGFLL